MIVKSISFDNTFNLVKDDISDLEIVESTKKDNCLIRDKNNTSRYYKNFILDENTRTKILCSIGFYPSSKTNKYLPRIIFKKTNQNLEVNKDTEKKDVNISFDTSEKAIVFWKLIMFLDSFKELVDLGDFDKSYKVAPRSKYFMEFESKDDVEQLEDVRHLIKNSKLSSNDIKSLLFEQRKKKVRTFYYLLTNKMYEGVQSLDYYRNKYSLKEGDENVWHHFLKNNDWILGLNVDIKFIRDFISEAKIGMEDSGGSGSPKSDILGISDYTTLIELKTAVTKIFKNQKTSKSRTNTWDFSPDFIEGLSQCLGQKYSLERSYASKAFLDENNQRINKEAIRTIDPKTVFIIGNRKIEFPHDGNNDNIIKSETFELFRRNNRNIDIITYDELFERAYHIVHSKKLPSNWYKCDSSKLINV